jgi:hypothetical protein
MQPISIVSQPETGRIDYFALAHDANSSTPDVPAVWWLGPPLQPPAPHTIATWVSLGGGGRAVSAFWRSVDQLSVVLVGEDNRLWAKTLDLSQSQPAWSEWVAWFPQQDLVIAGP